MKKIYILTFFVLFVFAQTALAKEVKYATKLYNSYNKEYYSILNRADTRKMHPIFTQARPTDSAIIYRDDMHASRAVPIERCKSLAARMIDERIEVICIDKKQAE